jgi:hypothetical protein
LTHPLIVEAIEQYFIPLLIHNNKEGKDAIILEKYKEASWNNPVARIIKPDCEEDLIDKLSGKYDMVSLITFLIDGIEKSGQVVPSYLDLLEKEYNVKELHQTHLSMYCFWSGEKNLAELEGVISTKAGFMNGTEVVQVVYDQDKIEVVELMDFASKRKCADALYSNDTNELRAANHFDIPTKDPSIFKEDKELKYYISKTDYRYIPMTSLQALKVNHALATKTNPDVFLSPRQLEIFRFSTAKKSKLENYIDKNFIESWGELCMKINE